MSGKTRKKTDKKPLLKTNPKALGKLTTLLRSVVSKIELPEELPAFLGDTMPMDTLENYKEMILQGEKPECAFYILRGFMWVYYFSDQEGEVITHFYGENMIVAFKDFLIKADSGYTIVAGRETLVSTIRHDDMLRMYKKWPQMESFAKDVVMAYDKYSHLQQANLRSMGFKERIAEFYLFYPKLLPAKWARVDDQVANYLGMGVRTLRKYRKLLGLK